MIRAFTISFDFDGKTYLALASIKQKEKDVCYFVKLYDDTLYRIIPDGHVSFNNTDGFTKLSLKHPLADKLMGCISRSITDHLDACHKF
jgi:hypothetical protein